MSLISKSDLYENAGQLEKADKGSGAGTKLNGGKLCKASYACKGG